MFSKNAHKTQSRIDSLVGAGTKVEGNLAFQGGLRIDGEVHGKVTASGDKSSTLVISEQARVEGEVSASHLVVNGTVIGPLRSSGFLELQPKARVTGDVEYNTIEMHLGAIVQGRLIHLGAVSKSVELKLATTNTSNG